MSDAKKRLEYDNIDSPVYESSASVNEDLKGKKQRKVWTYNLENDPLELFKEVFGDLKSNFSKTAAEDSTSFVQDRLRIPHSVVTISLKEAAEGTTRGVKFNSSSLKTLDNQEVLVIIPPGIEDGQTLRLKINGDTEALVQVKVEALDHFQRQVPNASILFVFVVETKSTVPFVLTKATFPGVVKPLPGRPVSLTLSTTLPTTSWSVPRPW